MPMSAAALGVAGVLPFALLTLAAIFEYDRRVGLASGSARDFLVLYGIVIASFVGGIRWGAAMRHPDPKERAMFFAMSVLAPLFAFAIPIVTRPPHDLTLLILIFLLLGFSDVMMARKGSAPAWYGTLRTVLTGLVVAILIVALAVLPLETGL
nr:DUF3429 family protein [Alsobacter ponti]